MKGACKQGRHQIHPSILHCWALAPVWHHWFGSAWPAHPTWTQTALESLFFCHLLLNRFLVSQHCDVKHQSSVWVRDGPALGSSPYVLSRLLMFRIPLEQDGFGKIIKKNKSPAWLPKLYTSKGSFYSCGQVRLLLKVPEVPQNHLRRIKTPWCRAQSCPCPQKSPHIAPHPCLHCLANTWWCLKRVSWNRGWAELKE